MKTSKQAFLISPAINEWQLGIQAELLSEIKGDRDVVIIICSYEKGYCTSNIFGSKTICKECKSNAVFFAKKFFTGTQVEYVKKSERRPIRVLQLKKDAIIDSISISTVNSRLRPVKKHWSTRHIKIYNSVYDYGVRFKTDITDICCAENVTDIYFYNGRVSPSGIVRTLMPQQINNYYGLEYNESGSEYYITKNTTIHDINLGRRNVEEYLNKRLSKSDILRAREFYERKSSSQVKYKKFDVSEVRSLGIYKNIVSVFLSSDDELSSLGPDWETDFTYDIQATLVNLMRHCPKVYFIIRIHPNQYGQGKKLTNIYKKIDNENSNCGVIYSRDKFDSYALIDDTDLVVTFGSTIGIEACYRGKPSVLLGVNKFDTSGSVIKPKSFLDAVKVIQNADVLQPTSTHGAIAYALYVMRPGKKFSYLTATPLGYSIEGVSLLPPNKSIKYRLAKFIQYLRLTRRDLIGLQLIRVMLISLRMYNIRSEKISLLK